MNDNSKWSPQLPHQIYHNDQQKKCIFEPNAAVTPALYHIILTNCTPQIQSLSFCKKSVHDLKSQVVPVAAVENDLCSCQQLHIS